MRHFGMLVPSTNTTCEIEFCRLPPEFQVHTARLGKGGNTPFSPSLDTDVAYQSKLLGDARHTADHGERLDGCDAPGWRLARERFRSRHDDRLEFRDREDHRDPGFRRQHRGRVRPPGR